MGPGLYRRPARCLLVFNADGSPAFCRGEGPGLAIARSPNEPLSTVYFGGHGGQFYVFGSRHEGIFHFALTDGSARVVNMTINTRMLGQLYN